MWHRYWVDQRTKFYQNIGLGDVLEYYWQTPADLATYGRDWTKVYAPAPSLLVRPRSTEEVSRFLKLATAHGIAVVPSGGRTGLAGGAHVVEEAADNPLLEQRETPRGDALPVVRPAAERARNPRVVPDGEQRARHLLAQRAAEEARLLEHQLAAQRPHDRADEAGAHVGIENDRHARALGLARPEHPHRTPRRLAPHREDRPRHRA
jgi:hypothetical protein